MGSYTPEKAWSDFRVGLFTLAGLSVLILGVTFAGGDKGLLFQKISTVKALLFDVGGLKKGSSVTMGGMVVGRVTGIAFKDGQKGNLIEVTMEIRSSLRERIKTDSIPAVRTQGMLGDRYIDLSMGTETAGPLPEGGILKGGAASDFDATLRQASEVMVETKTVLNSVDDLIRDFKKNPRRYVKFSLF